MSQPSAVPKIFRVEENDGDCDVVPEVSDHVLREGEHLGQLGVVNAVGGATKGVSAIRGNIDSKWNLIMKGCDLCKARSHQN